MPPDPPPEFDDPFRQYWDWVGVALFLLLTVDMITTVYAARVHGVGAESNPVMRWLLAQGTLELVAAHLAVLVLLGAFFWGIDQVIDGSPDPLGRPAAVAVEVWVGGLVAIGLFVFANNLSVIVLGRSLL